MGSPLACIECKALLNEYVSRQREYRDSVKAYHDAVISTHDPAIAHDAYVSMNEARDFARYCERMYRDHTESNHTMIDIKEAEPQA